MLSMTLFCVSTIELNTNLLINMHVNTELQLQNKSTACGCQRLAMGFLIEVKKSKSKYGHNSEKNTFWIVSLESMDCSFDSEHAFRGSSKYLQ